MWDELLKGLVVILLFQLWAVWRNYDWRDELEEDEDVSTDQQKSSEGTDESTEEGNGAEKSDTDKAQSGAEKSSTNKKPSTTDNVIPPDKNTLKLDFGPGEEFPEKFSLFGLCRKVSLREIPSIKAIMSKDVFSLRAGMKVFHGRYIIPLSKRKAAVQGGKNGLKSSQSGLKSSQRKPAARGGSQKSPRKPAHEHAGERLGDQRDFAVEFVKTASRSGGSSQGESSDVLLSTRVRKHRVEEFKIEFACLRIYNLEGVLRDLRYILKSRRAKEVFSSNKNDLGDSVNTAGGDSVNGPDGNDPTSSNASANGTNKKKEGISVVFIRFLFFILYSIFGESIIRPIRVLGYLIRVIWRTLKTYVVWPAFFQLARLFQILSPKIILKRAELKPISYYAGWTLLLGAFWVWTPVVMPRFWSRSLPTAVWGAVRSVEAAAGLRVGRQGQPRKPNIFRDTAQYFLKLVLGIVKFVLYLIYHIFRMAFDLGPDADQYSIHFTGYCYLFGFLPVPFISLQLPTWLVPTLNSGDVEDIMESALPRDSEFFTGSVTRDDNGSSENDNGAGDFGSSSSNFGNNRGSIYAAASGTTGTASSGNDNGSINSYNAPVTDMISTSKEKSSGNGVRRRSLVLKSAEVGNRNANLSQQNPAFQNQAAGQSTSNRTQYQGKRVQGTPPQGKKKKNRGSLLDKVDIHRIPLQQVFETIFQFGKSFDVKCDGQISFPKMDLSFSLPDKSRSKIQIDSMRQERPCGLAAWVRGGYCDQGQSAGERSSNAVGSGNGKKSSAKTGVHGETAVPSPNSPDFSRVFLCFENLTIDGQTLVEGENNADDADPAKSDSDMRKNVFILENHLRPIWDCSAEILSWLVYNSIEKKSVDVLDRLLKRTEDAAAPERLSSPGSALTSLSDEEDFLSTKGAAYKHRRHHDSEPRYPLTGIGSNRATVQHCTQRKSKMTQIEKTKDSQMKRRTIVRSDFNEMREGSRPRFGSNSSNTSKSSVTSDISYTSSKGSPKGSKQELESGSAQGKNTRKFFAIATDGPEATEQQQLSDSPDATLNADADTEGSLLAFYHQHLKKGGDLIGGQITTAMTSVERMTERVSERISPEIEKMKSWGEEAVGEKMREIERMKGRIEISLKAEMDRVKYNVQSTLTKQQDRMQGFVSSYEFMSKIHDLEEFEVFLRDFEEEERIKEEEGEGNNANFATRRNKRGSRGGSKSLSRGNDRSSGNDRTSGASKLKARRSRQLAQASMSSAGENTSEGEGMNTNEENSEDDGMSDGTDKISSFAVLAYRRNLVSQLVRQQLLTQKKERVKKLLKSFQLSGNLETEEDFSFDLGSGGAANGTRNTANTSSNTESSESSTTVMQSGEKGRGSEEGTLRQRKRKSNTGTKDGRSGESTDNSTSEATSRENSAVDRSTTSTPSSAAAPAKNSTSANNTSVPRVHVLYDRPGMIGKVESTCSVHSVEISWCRFRTKNLWALGAEKRTNFLRIPESVDLRLKVNGITVDESVLDDGTTEVQFFTQPMNLVVRGFGGLLGGASGSGDFAEHRNSGNRDPSDENGNKDKNDTDKSDTKSDDDDANPDALPVLAAHEFRQRESAHDFSFATPEELRRRNSRKSSLTSHTHTINLTSSAATFGQGNKRSTRAQIAKTEEMNENKNEEITNLTKTKNQSDRHVYWRVYPEEPFCFEADGIAAVTDDMQIPELSLYAKASVPIEMQVSGIVDATVLAECGHLFTGDSLGNVGVLEKTMEKTRDSTNIRDSSAHSGTVGTPLSLGTTAATTSSGSESDDFFTGIFGTPDSTPDSINVVYFNGSQTDVHLKRMEVTYGDRTLYLDTKDSLGFIHKLLEKSRANGSGKGGNGTGDGPDESTNGTGNGADNDQSNGNGDGNGDNLRVDMNNVLRKLVHSEGGPVILPRFRMHLSEMVLGHVASLQKNEEERKGSNTTNPKDERKLFDRSSAAAAANSADVSASTGNWKLVDAGDNANNSDGPVALRDVDLVDLGIENHPDEFVFSDLMPAKFLVEWDFRKPENEVLAERWNAVATANGNRPSIGGISRVSASELNAETGGSSEPDENTEIGFGLRNGSFSNSSKSGSSSLPTLMSPIDGKALAVLLEEHSNEDEDHHHSSKLAASVADYEEGRSSPWGGVNDRLFVKYLSQAERTQLGIADVKTVEEEMEEQEAEAAEREAEDQLLQRGSVMSTKNEGSEMLERPKTPGEQDMMEKQKSTIRESMRDHEAGGEGANISSRQIQNQAALSNPKHIPVSDAMQLWLATKGLLERENEKVNESEDTDSESGNSTSNSGVEGGQMSRGATACQRGSSKESSSKSYRPRSGTNFGSAFSAADDNNGAARSSARSVAGTESPAGVQATNSGGFQHPFPSSIKGGFVLFDGKEGTVADLIPSETASGSLEVVVSGSGKVELKSVEPRAEADLLDGIMVVGEQTFSKNPTQFQASSEASQAITGKLLRRLASGTPSSGGPSFENQFSSRILLLPGADQLTAAGSKRSTQVTNAIRSSLLQIAANTGAGAEPNTKGDANTGSNTNNSTSGSSRLTAPTTNHYSIEDNFVKHAEKRALDLHRGTAFYARPHCMIFPDEHVKIANFLRRMRKHRLYQTKKPWVEGEARPNSRGSVTTASTPSNTATSGYETRCRKLLDFVRANPLRRKKPLKASLVLEAEMISEVLARYGVDVEEFIKNKNGADADTNQNLLQQTVKDDLGIEFRELKDALYMLAWSSPWKFCYFALGHKEFVNFVLSRHETLYHDRLRVMETDANVSRESGRDFHPSSGYDKFKQSADSSIVLTHSVHPTPSVEPGNAENADPNAVAKDDVTVPKDTNVPPTLPHSAAYVPSERFAQIRRKVKKDLFLRMHLPMDVVIHWLHHQPLIGAVFSSICVLRSKEIKDSAYWALHQLKRVLQIMNTMEVEMPSDLIPATALTRFAGEMLGKPQLYIASLYPVVMRITRGEGADIDTLKKIITDCWKSSQEYDVELDHFLIWTDKLLKSMPPVHPIPVTTKEDAVASASREMRRLLKQIPTAKDLYDSQYFVYDDAKFFKERVGDDLDFFDLDDLNIHRNSEIYLSKSQKLRIVIRIAPYLTAAQLQFLLPRLKNRLEKLEGAYPRMKYMLQLKLTFEKLVESYGDLSFLPQAHAISLLLGDAADRSRSKSPNFWDRKFGTSMWGPEAMASLLRMCLNSSTAGHNTQRNIRALLETLLVQPKLYVLGVMQELSINGSQRILCLSLMALLETSQSCFQVNMRRDYCQLLSDKLEVELPQREWFLAGGKYCKLSYYQLMDAAAKRLLAEAADYLALKKHVCFQKSGYSRLERLSAAAMAARNHHIASSTDTRHAASVIGPSLSNAQGLRIMKSPLTGSALMANTSAHSMPWQFRMVSPIKSDPLQGMRWIATSLMETTLKSIAHAEELGKEWLLRHVLVKTAAAEKQLLRFVEEARKKEGDSGEKDGANDSKLAAIQYRELESIFYASLSEEMNFACLQRNKDRVFEVLREFEAKVKGKESEKQSESSGSSLLHQLQPLIEADLSQLKSTTQSAYESAFANCRELVQESMQYFMSNAARLKRSAGRESFASPIGKDLKATNPKDLKAENNGDTTNIAGSMSGGMGYLFGIPALKSFYERNYEALMVQKIVENIEQDIDNVRSWLLAQPCCSEQECNADFGTFFGENGFGDFSEVDSCGVGNGLGDAIVIQSNNRDIINNNLGSPVTPNQSSSSRVVGGSSKQLKQTASAKFANDPSSSSVFHAFPTVFHEMGGLSLAKSADWLLKPNNLFGTPTKVTKSNNPAKKSFFGHIFARSNSDEFHDCEEGEEGDAEFRLRTLPLKNGDHLLALAVKSVYFHEGDRDKAWSDPLCRLLLGEPSYTVDYTIISAMGVVTDGAAGFEMQATYERIREERGVKFIRADTGIAKPLEWNARQAEKAVRKVKTRTWGWVGYSQGCANMWKCESMLMQGTPQQQQLLYGLVSRNNLYSAANGTPHATQGERKATDLFVDIEEFLKRYQVRMSSQLVNIFLNTLTYVFCSQETTALLGGINSLNHASATQNLWRDAQHKALCPTFAIRAVVEEHTLPESLTQLCYILTKQMSESSIRSKWVLDRVVGPAELVAVGGGSPGSDGGGGKEDGSALIRGMLRAALEGSGSGGNTNSHGAESADAAMNTTPNNSKTQSSSGDANGEPDEGFQSLEGNSKNSSKTSQEQEESKANKQKNDMITTEGVDNEGGNSQSNANQNNQNIRTGQRREVAIWNHDTQVCAEESHGYPLYTANENGLKLRACYLQNYAQRTHHWSPLTEKETGLMTTRSDVKKAIFEGCKDRHIFPWVLVNARFGVIPRK